MNQQRVVTVQSTDKQKFAAALFYTQMRTILPTNLPPIRFLSSLGTSGMHECVLPLDGGALTIQVQLRHLYRKSGGKRCYVRSQYPQPVSVSVQLADQPTDRSVSVFGRIASAARAFVAPSQQ